MDIITNKKFRGNQWKLEKRKKSPDKKKTFLSFLLGKYKLEISEKKETLTQKKTDRNPKTHDYKTKTSQREREREKMKGQELTVLLCSVCCFFLLRHSNSILLLLPANSTGFRCSRQTDRQTERRSSEPRSEEGKGL